MATAKRTSRQSLPARARKQPAKATPPHSDFYEDWQRYFDLYNFAPVAYIRLNRYGVVEEINRAGIVSLGVPQGTIMGRPLIVFVAPESRLDFLEHMRRCRVQETVVETDLSLATRQGRILAVRAYSKRSQSVNREVYWTVLIDLTEQHRLDAARREAEAERARAENEERLGRQTNEATHRFLNVLSHELRTPLTPALFAASRLLEHDMPENVRRLGAVISRNIQSEARLIDDLLDVSRIERGVLGLTLSPTDLHLVINNVVESCRPQAVAKGVSIVTALRAGRHFINGDPGRLRQVFSNLVNNAIKFTDHGAIEIVTSNDDPGALRVTVSDTGIGIEEGSVETLFRSFTQHRPVEPRRAGARAGDLRGNRRGAQWPNLGDESRTRPGLDVRGRIRDDQPRPGADGRRGGGRCRAIRPRPPYSHCRRRCGYGGDPPGFARPRRARARRRP